MATSLALVLAWAAPAGATTVQFDPDGLGGTLAFKNIDTLDWTPGNTMAIGINVSSTAPTSFRTLYQAALGSALDSSSNPVFQQSALGTTDSTTGVFAPVWYSIVGDFGETLISRTPNAGNPALLDLTFAFDPTQASSFTIYAGSAGQPDALTGVCYVCGPAVLSGVVTGNGFTSKFTGVTTAAAAALDLAGTNNYPSVTTVTGSGDFNINVAITSVNSAYFKAIAVGDVINVGNFNGNTLLPFTQVNPSACFGSTAHLGGTSEAALLLGANCVGGTPGVGSVSPINGVSQPRIMFQSDSNTAFQTTTPGVPEPATLTLLGFGLLGAAAKRRLKKK